MNDSDEKSFPPDSEVLWIAKDGSEHWEEDQILSILLKHDCLFVGNSDSDPFFGSDGKKPKTTLSVWVNCNDIFAWACADCEPITLTELPELYKMHKADPKWGDVKWTCKKRNEQPQRPVVEMMKKAGAWDDMMESLDKNWYDNREK